METPSSTTRVTRSQTLAASNNITINNSSSNNIPVSRKIEDSEKNLSKTRQRSGQQQDRSALVDITNDSPIVGLASGVNLETTLSSMAKRRGSRVKNTPGSGEALLRGQVKTLLQKVEEEAELSKLSIESRPFLHQLVNSPMGLVAPTPANTPQIQNLSGSTGLVSVTPSLIIQQQLIPQVVNHMFDEKNEEDSESEKSVITRSLLLDFSEKSEISDATEGCFSELSYQEVVVQGGGGSSCNVVEKPWASTEDDDASVWSIQVNASTHDEDDEEEEEEDIAEGEEDYYEDVEEEEDDDDGGLLLDEVCEDLNNIRIAIALPKFAGKHTRFVYNSDDELVKEEVEENSVSSSPNMLRLKGLPTPMGKHLRFSE